MSQFHLLSPPPGPILSARWDTWRVLTGTWSPHPSVLAGCAALIAAYWLATPRLTARFGAYLAGVLVLCLALVSPLDTLGDRYLFGLHMAQHLLLTLVAPPLLLLGLTPADLRAALRIPALDRAERLLSSPPLAWSLAVATMWIWHLPALYDAAVASQPLHILQHLSFLVTGVIFWWPVVAPLPERARLPHLGAALYLLGASLASAILGIVITFAPAGLYPAYQHPADPEGLLGLLRDDWGLSPAADQQLGGLLMWVPGGLAYLLAILGVIARWYAEPEEEYAP